MEGLRKKLVLVVGLATISLVIQLVTYIYNIQEFGDDLRAMEGIHQFRVDILQLRRFEKNFVYGIQAEDLVEMEDYLSRIVTVMKEISASPVFSTYDAEIGAFNKDLLDYRALTEAAQAGEQIDLEQLRNLGRRMLNFSQNVLEHKQGYIGRCLEKIVVVPATVMFLFGSALIVALILLTRAIMKQIKFVTSTTLRIAQGDFRPVAEHEVGYTTYPMIIKAFNAMIKELDYRHEQVVQSRKLAAVGILASGIAHEVNNPLNNISLTAEALIEQKDELTVNEQDEMVLDILSEVTRASKVVNNLLDFSRAQGKMVFEPVDAVNMLKTTLRLIRNQVMLAGVQLKTDFPEEECWIRGDLDSLKQVFINLCLNAIQAMPDGGLLSLSITCRDESMATVVVEDTGNGMPPEVLEKIFDPFFTTKSTGKGTGLGLSVVYGIVNKHEGYIEVNSALEKGTTFAVSFPRLDAASIHDTGSC